MAVSLLGALASGICGCGIGYLISEKRHRSRGGKTNGKTVAVSSPKDHDKDEPDLDSPSVSKLTRQKSPHYVRKMSGSATYGVRKVRSAGLDHLQARSRSRSSDLGRDDHDTFVVPLEERRRVYGLGGYSQHNRVILCMVGLPARGKSYIVKMMIRYLQWQGFPVKAFNAGSIRRAKGMAGVSAEFFSSNDAAQTREQIATACMEEALSWLRSQNSVCVAIFDATNTTSKRRRTVVEKCEDYGGITPVFIESICDDPKILTTNYGMKLENDDYKDMDPAKARADFLERVKVYEQRYEPVEDGECNGSIRYVKLFNVGQKVVMHNCSGYVVSNVGFYLSNIHIKPRRIWLMRHAETEEQRKGQLGSVSGKLTDRGARYCREVTKFIYREINKMKLEGNEEGAEVLVLTGTAPVHAATSESLQKASSSSGELGKAAAETVGRFPVMSTSLLNELDGGDCNGMSYAQIQEEFPDIWEERERDKLNFRYPGAGGESYCDVIHRLGPIILELERQSHSVLVISHLAVQRCIFGYYDNTKLEDIPHLQMEMHTLYELSPGPHGTKMKPINLD